MPRFPGVTSALGCVIADIRHDGSRRSNLALDGLDVAALERAHGRRARARPTTVVAAAGLAVERIDTVYELDMHYVGQTHTVPVPVRYAPSTADSIARGLRRRLSRRAFSRLLPGIPVRILSLRTAAIGRRPPFDLQRAGARRALCSWPTRDAAAATCGSRAGRTRRRCGLASISPSARAIDGPAILEQPDATTVVEPAMRARVDDLGNLVLERR